MSDELLRDERMALSIRVAISSKEERLPCGCPLPKDRHEVYRCYAVLCQCLPQGMTGIRRRLVEGEEVGHFLTWLDHHEDLRPIGSYHDLELGECGEDEVKAPPLRPRVGEDGCTALLPD